MKIHVLAMAITYRQDDWLLKRMKFILTHSWKVSVHDCLLLRPVVWGPVDSIYNSSTWQNFMDMLQKREREIPHSPL